MSDYLFKRIRHQTSMLPSITTSEPTKVSSSPLADIVRGYPCVAIVGLAEEKYKSPC